VALNGDKHVYIGFLEEIHVHLEMRESTRF
jgi:hypothetical protein